MSSICDVDARPLYACAIRSRRDAISVRQARHRVQRCRTQHARARSDSIGEDDAVLVPNVLLASCAVVTTSTKDDVMRTTAAVRSDVGHVQLFDPSGTVPCPPGVRRVGWSPVHAASSWDAPCSPQRARRRGTAPGAGQRAPDHWTERALALCSRRSCTRRLVGRRGSLNWPDWVDLSEGEEPLGTIARVAGIRAHCSGLARRGAGDRRAGALGDLVNDRRRAARLAHRRRTFGRRGRAAARHGCIPPRERTRCTSSRPLATRSRRRRSSSA